MDALRDIHDLAAAPIILVGTAKILETTNDVDLWHGQFSSRVALRLDVTEMARGDADGNGPGGATGGTLHSVDEIRRLYESDRVRFTGDGLSFLADVANALGLGALRLASQLVAVASQVAQAEGAAAIDARILRRVLRTMHGVVTADRIQSASERARARVRIA